MAIDLDHDESSTVFGSLSAGRWSIRAGVAHRHKQVPTASFGSVFGDDREVTDDSRAYVSAPFTTARSARGWWARRRVAYNYYGYGARTRTTTATTASRCPGTARRRTR